MHRREERGDECNWKYSRHKQVREYIRNQKEHLKSIFTTKNRQGSYNGDDKTIQLQYSSSNSHHKKGVVLQATAETKSHS